MLTLGGAAGRQSASFEIKPLTQLVPFRNTPRAMLAVLGVRLLLSILDPCEHPRSLPAGP